MSDRDITTTASRQVIEPTAEIGFKKYDYLVARPCSTNGMGRSGSCYPVTYPCSTPQPYRSYCQPMCAPACAPGCATPCMPCSGTEYYPMPCDPCDPCDPVPVCCVSNKYKTYKPIVSHDDPQYLDGCRRVVEFMFTMWQNQTMCDVMFMYDGGKILAHKVALAAYSEFLVQRFNEYPPGEVVSIDMTDFTVDIVSMVLSFVYTTEIELTDKTVGPIMKCADELGICHLSNMCIEYLSNLTVDIAVIFYSVTENYKLEEMKENAFKYILSRFVEVSNTRHFNYLPYERLVKILSDDRLNVQGELDVFYAALRWVDYNRAERMAMMPKLLREVIRLHFITPESLVRNVEPLMSDFPECAAAVNDALRYHALNMSDSRLALKSFPKQRARCYRPS